MGEVLWVLVCVGFLGLVVSQQPESEYYKTLDLGVSRLSTPLAVSKNSARRSNWDGKGRKEEVYNRCPKEEMVQNAKLQPGLFFSNGYWEQSLEAPSILPYSAADGNKSGVTQTHPVHLASFRRLRSAGASGEGDTIRASLVLEIAAGMETIAQGMNTSRNERLRTEPGYSSLTISLEGVMYKKQEGEISLCMLGCRLLPDSPTATEDCNVMLRIQYPNKLSLIKRVIRADITSLSNEGEKHYFHPVNVTALTNTMFTQPYEYTVGDVTAQVCNDPSQGLAMEDRFPEPEFVQVLQMLLTGPLDVEPSLNCSKSEEFCNNMGPFGRFAPSALQQLERSVSKTRVSFRDFRFSWSFSREDAMMNGNWNSDSSAERNVSAVIGAGQWPIMYTTQIDKHTLVAEGSWKNETKQLCMVACQADAVIANVSSECNVRICLEIAISLSLKQRSVVSGTISSTRLHNEPCAFNPLLLSQAFHYLYLSAEVHNRLHYTFNHIEEANSFRGKFEPDSGQSTTIKMITSKYPALRGNNSEDYFALNDELSISSHLISQSSKSKKTLKLKVELLAIEDHVTVRYGRMGVVLVSGMPAKKKETAQLSSLKVAAQIVISERWGYDDPLAEYAAEGWYEPKDGKMYMVGCQAVNANWTMLQDNKRFLSGRLDCDLTLLLEYPSTVARWLSRSSVKVSIKSKRNTDDPFYFSEISYETFPITYMQQRKDMFTRNNLEGALSAVTLLVMLICIVVQLGHISQNHDSAPFISLGMLGVQATGYMMPLITEAEALFARSQPQAWGFPTDQWSQGIKLTIKLLTLLAFLLILRLMERVWKARVSQAQKADLNMTGKNSLPPQESNVILVCGIVHLVSFLLVLAVHSMKSPASESSETTEWSGPELIYSNSPPNTMETEAKEYWGLVEDLFLFPQVVGNVIWEVKGKPLHPTYYIGITILRLLPHLYDRLYRPFLPQFDVNSMYANPNADFYTLNADIVIPMLATFLVLLVYFQQKWKGWLVLPSQRLYSKLPVKNTETELVSTQIPGATMFSDMPEVHDEE